MQLTRRFRLPATTEQAWEAFSHLERVAPFFPGAVLTPTGPDSFRGSVNMKIGPVPLTYTGTGTYLDRSAGRRRVVVQARGQDERGLGGAAVQVRTSLHARGAETEVEVVTELELTGKPARYGTAVIEQAVDKLLDQFVSSLTERFATGTVGAMDGSVGAPVPPSVAAPAVDAGAPNGTDVVPPLAPTSTQPRHSDGRPPVGTVQVPRRAQAPSGSAVLVRRYGPVALAAAVVSVVALRLIRR